MIVEIVKNKRGFRASDIVAAAGRIWDEMVRCCGADDLPDEMFQSFDLEDFPGVKVLFKI